MPWTDTDYVALAAKRALTLIKPILTAAHDSFKENDEEAEAIRFAVANFEDRLAALAAGNEIWQDAVAEADRLACAAQGLAEDTFPASTRLALYQILSEAALAESRNNNPEPFVPAIHP